jgi:hypothetical protein
MRRLLCGLVAIGTLAASGAQAMVQCPEPADQAAFEMVALKTALMVVATTCDSGDRYNAFVRRYQPSLVDTDRSLSSYFKRHYGARGQQEYDRYATDLANTQSRGGLTQGTDFCARSAALFDEVMALPTATQLASYAAGKDLVPAAIGVCPGAAPAKPVVKTAATSAPAAKRTAQK